MALNSHLPLMIYLIGWVECISASVHKADAPVNRTIAYDFKAALAAGFWPYVFLWGMCKILWKRTF